MANDTRPLPSLEEPDTGPFWSATKQHELRYQQCDDCDTIVFYPRRHCTGCLGLNLTWNTSAGQGVIYSYSVVVVSRDPAFSDNVPYAIALVDLDEGFRMFTNITGVDDPLTDIEIGQRVTVDWEDHEELAIPNFRPA